MKRGLASVAFFALTTFATAFLIFLVQPLVGKHILPWFGGSPGVWMLCLGFYQTTLFLGYAYAHVLSSEVPPRVQPFVHAAFALAAVAVLPVLPDDAWKPVGENPPGTRILAMLAANVALPFFLLASTGPLVQSWFARALPGRSPYPLYAVSNLGSLLALIAYPFWIEPRWTLSGTSSAWSYAFVASAAAVVACSLFAARAGGRSAGVEAPATAGASHDEGRPVTPITVALWVALAACAVIQFMGVTNKLCLDIASVPFLWIVPLCIYLLTFILAFSGLRLYRRVPYAIAWLASIVVLEASAHWGVGPDALRAVQGQVVLYPLVLFLGCMLAHGELARLRPPTRSLTAFYLCISAGGALGGLFVGLLAPRVFDDYYELSIGILGGWLLLLLAAGVERADAATPRRGRGFWRTAAALASVGLVALFVARGEGIRDDVLSRSRNFFGIMRVVDVAPRSPNHRLQLWHGSTVHGVQFVEAPHEPTAYYARTTGVGLALEQVAARGPTKVGVIGLGIGTLAAYGRDGDRMTFYELDPDVIAMALDETYFRFLADCKADVELVPGDARLTLEDELDEGRAREFDLLVLDAFNSDSIPVHLLTVEAFRLYEQHVAAGGAIAVHASNRHFNLMPLVLRLGLEVGRAGLVVRSSPLAHQRSEKSTWILLSRDPTFLQGVADRGAQRVKALGLEPGFLQFFGGSKRQGEDAPLWTDDYSDLFGLLMAVQ